MLKNENLENHSQKMTERNRRHELFEQDDMERKAKEDGHHGHGRITINVGGQRHETYLTTLRNHPDTRLYWITERHHTSTKSPEYNAEKKEYFFDRHPGVFAHIVNYYRTGKLHCPMDVCGPLFEEELSFWGIDERQVELCCWESYKQHKEKQEKLKYFTPPNDDDDQDDDIWDASLWTNVRKKGYTLLEKPASSTLAKVVSIVNVLTFFITVVQFCLTTVKSFKDDSQRINILSGIRIFTVTWFLFDLVLRLLFAPSLVEYFKKILHWVDLVSVCALIVHVKLHHVSSETEISPFEMLIFLKSVRLFNLMTFSFVIQVLTNTLKASSRELCLLTIVVLFQAFVFSAILFFIERDKTEKFESVPQSLWWAIITMTTVGYGDIHPKTWLGKIFGCCCALCGALVIALPVSVVATNFSLFYTYAKARLNLPPKAQQKLPLSKELTSLKAKKAQFGHSAMNYSSNSIPRKYEHAPKGSVERLSPENENKPTENCSHKSSSSERRGRDSGTFEQDPVYYEKGERPPGEQTDMTPSFQEHTFDFLEVPSSKRLKKSFLSSSFSKVFGAITQPGRRSHAPESAVLLDVNSTYPLYCRRGAVAPGSVSSRSLSSTIYDSTSSNLPNCVKRSVTALRRRQRLDRSGKLKQARKCTSNAELHLVCLHRCDRHPGAIKGALNLEAKAASSDCSCSSHLSVHPTPRQAKSCSELNDILLGNFRNSVYSDNFSSGDTSMRSESLPLTEVAITINDCSDDGMGTKDTSTPLLKVDSPNTKGGYLNPQE